MPDAFQNAFAGLLGTDLAEQVSYIPAGGEEENRVTLYASVRRPRNSVDRSRSVGLVYEYIVQVYLGTHATYGGFAADAPPVRGLKFKLPLVKGGVAVDGWMVGEIQAARGKWMLTCTYAPDRSSVGGHEKTGVGVGNK
ncbi:MAG: hypothetical protein KIS92_04480 [Planctomycetota bacterium]|nr:hypothetical protein [Planctomycetota bacterium]